MLADGSWGEICVEDAQAPAKKTIVSHSPRFGNSLRPPEDPKRRHLSGIRPTLAMGELPDIHGLVYAAEPSSNFAR